MAIDFATIKDRVKGAIFGQCLGDAVGLATEFRFKNDIKPRDYEFPYTKPIRGFPLNDWTDDSDQMILLMESLTNSQLKVTPETAKDFAKRLTDWARSGFPELGDTHGMGLGGSTNLVINHPKFLNDPFAASYDIWHQSGRKLAPNGSLMRTSIVSALPTADLVEIAAVNLGRVTHMDPRCVASCVIFNRILYNLIYHPPADSSACDAIFVGAIRAGQHYITGMDTNPQTKMITLPGKQQPTPASYIDSNFSTREEELAWYLKTAWTDPAAIDKFELDARKSNGATIGYVFKTFGCAVYAMRVVKVALRGANGSPLIPSFKKTIQSIVREGGDADTNAAVVGAILGAHLGYARLPSDWLEALPNRAWLDAKIDTFLEQLRPIICGEAVEGNNQKETKQDTETDELKKEIDEVEMLVDELIEK